MRVIDVKAADKVLIGDFVAAHFTVATRLSVAVERDVDFIVVSIDNTQFNGEHSKCSS